MSVQDTCTKDKCPAYANGTCPMLVESWWTPPATESGPPVLVVDCAPKRTMLMVQDLSNRMLGVEKSQEEMRNKSVDVITFIEASQKIFDVSKLQSLPEGNLT